MPPKRRRRFQGLYYHSSPPKVLPMNGQIANNTGRRRRDPDDLSVKLSTIRIWMHEKDIGKLTRVLWAGQGNRLRQQASTNPKVKRFLAAVPYVMNSIKDVHQAVIDNSLENLQANLEPPVPPALVTCRDANGLNLIHKAAGLGHATILEYLIQTWPDGVHETDITGKTPLHWAASAKNNMRCYTLLTQAGCDEEAVDYKMKTPSFYRHKPHEIERAFLTFVPEAPRVSPDIATDWEALSDESGDGKKLDIKIPEMNGFGRHSNAESNENTSEAEMTEAASGQEDEEMSKDGDAAEENAEADAESEPEEEKEPETKDENEGTEEPPAEEKENEKDEATETKEDEEKEKEEAKEKEEEKEEEKETQNETEEKEEEKAQDEKQQTETLNVTTANLTKASEEQQEEEKDQNKSNEGDNNTSHTKDDVDHKAATENEKMGEESKEDKEIKEQEIEATDEKSLEKEQNDKDKEPLDKGKIETKEDDNENVKKTAVGEKSIEEENEESIKEKTNEIDNEEKEKATPDEKTNQEDNDEKNKENLKENNKETVGEEIKTGDDEKSKEENKKEISGEEITTSDENVKNEEEKNIKNSELKIEQDQSEDNSNKSNDEEKDNEKDNEETKTLGETLVDIKDEVKENVKYLANSIKNVFSDKTPNKEEEDVKENSTPKADENKDNLEKVLDNEKSKEAEDKTSDKETDHKAPDNDKPLENGKLKETDENEDKNKQSPLKDIPDKSENIINNENPKEKTEENKETTVEPTTSNDKGPISSEDDSNENAQTKIDDAIKANENSNSSNEITKTPTPTSSPPRTAAKTPTKETPKKENDKTEEDENNNTNKLTNEIANSSTTTQKTETTTSKPNTAETLIDDKLKELNKSLEEYQKEEEQALEKEEKDIGEKLEEMADSLKENVKDMADKVVNLFSTTKDATEKMENESSEVVVHTESPHKQTPSKKVVKDTESSDETADEDEEPEGEAENEENNNEQNEEETQNDEENKDENENEAEAETTTEPKPEQIDQENKSETEANAETEESKENENDNLDDEEREGEGEGSLTSSLAIEGFVQGDAEDNTVQSQTAAYVHDDEEQRIQNIITSGDMEQLAQIVLNGDGQKLLNVEATEPEIQAFLKNVPNYMGKIKRVHEAARNGSLLNLQQALDRRKFAIAKDEISPNGATPLHVAVLFGNSDIVRYLSARFPETMTITDDDGRTPLHYASVINDNGHFYNVLLQLGANPKDVDKMGHTPEDYLSKEELKDILNYGQLLKRFGAEELEEQLLSDQGQIENQSCQENPIFKTEQGKYLADNLADPLIKALTQVAQKRPNDPLQYLTNYLQSYVSSRNTNGRTIAQVAVHSGSSQTNSTRLASSKPSTPAQKRQTTLMNGHAKYDNTDNIEEDSMQQNQESEDDGNDSDAAMSKKLEERDEHGQSMLHFACARSHRKGGLIHLIEEAKADITYRDELYRTARDVALQANQLGNAKEIDRYVMSLAIVGDIKPFEHFAVSGYDHIIDILDENETPIIDVVESRGLHELAEYLKTIRPLEELREELHQMIRDNNVERVKEIANGPSGKWLIKAKNYYGRTALHIAILKESIEIVEHFIKICPEALKIGDNLERTPLHYAMGTNIIESISRILIQNGAKRTYKDLKGRQPSYYFMNKADILRLQEEEDENR